MIKFPTTLYQQTAEIAAAFFTAIPQTDTVLVVNSCARGQATPESDLDMAVLLEPTATQDDILRLEQQWLDYAAAHPVVTEFKRTGHFKWVHLDCVNGQFTASHWDEGGGPDYYEVEIGNRVAYAAPLTTPGPHFRQLQATWLPYYNESQRLDRLAMVRHACAYDLDHVPYYVRRGLYFQAFDRLYKAHQEFLQALFIARRTYPLAYNKWIREQVERWLGLPELYVELPRVLSVSQLESSELEHKANLLRALLEKWA